MTVTNTYSTGKNTGVVEIDSGRSYAKVEWKARPSAGIYTAIEVSVSVGGPRARTDYSGIVALNPWFRPARYTGSLPQMEIPLGMINWHDLLLDVAA